MQTHKKFIFIECIRFSLNNASNLIHYNLQGWRKIFSKFGKKNNDFMPYKVPIRETKLICHNNRPFRFQNLRSGKYDSHLVRKGIIF